MGIIGWLSAAREVRTFATLGVPCIVQGSNVELGRALRPKGGRILRLEPLEHGNNLLELTVVNNA